MDSRTTHQNTTPQRRATILVVDDAHQNLQLLTNLLTSAGHCVRAARDGRVALESALEQPPDLVLLDIRMPVMDGFETCRQLKAHERTCKIPIIFISGLENIEDKVAAFDAGGVDYITKPFQANEVLSRVATHLSMNRMHKELEEMVALRTDELEKSNRALRMLSQTNQLLVRADQRDDFVRNVCQVIVDIGRFPHCFVDLPEKGNQKALFAAGCDKNWLEHYPTGDSPVAEVFRAAFERLSASGQPLVIQDIEAEMHSSQWLAHLYDKGLRGGFYTPLVRNDAAIGCLAIFADRPNAFDHSEIQRLKELSDDLAFGIGILEERAQHSLAQIALAESEMRYRMLFEKAGDAILVLKIEPPEAGRIADANHAAAKMHGYSVEEMIGLHITDLDAPEDAKESGANFERIVKGEWLHDEIAHLRKDGTIFPTEISAGLVQIGEHRFILAFIRDITSRKKMEADKKALEDQIRQANKMEAIGTLASGIAHDFNNILFAISGFTELSIQYTPDESILRQNLLKIQRANQRAAELVSQILTLSRKKDHSVQAMQPKLVIKEALKLLRATLPSTIDFQMDIRSDAYVDADATQIHQVIMNLCVNANHAMEGTGGVLTIRLVDRTLAAPDVEKSLDLKPGPYIELTVADTGKGIPENIKDRVFDPYFTTKPQERGTGLGLAVVHSIVKSYLGDIRIASEEGKGCTVTVLLPCVSGNQKEEAKEETSLPKGDESVLFVDDEDILIDIGRQMLEMLGYRVTTRSNGPDALALYREDPAAFDLVITDYTMPKMTGPQLAAEIHEITPTQPIILVSGMETPLSELQARQLGIKSFIRKPVVLKEIATAVRTALD